MSLGHLLWLYVVSVLISLISNTGPTGSGDIELIFSEGSEIEPPACRRYFSIISRRCTTAAVGTPPSFNTKKKTFNHFVTDRK